VARRRRVPSAAVVSLVAAALLADGGMAGIPARRPPAPLPDAATLRDQVVLHLPVEPYPDIAATWRAATGGWRSVNGYSGYGPNYYTALSVAAQTADATMFAPFRRDRDLYVVVDDGDGKMRALIESQPGSALQFQGGGFAHYRLPRSPQPAPRVHLRALPIARVESSCARETVVFASDRDERTRWECLQDAERHGLVADLGEARAVSAIVYSVGPYAWNVPTQLAVETSLDGTAWQTVSSGSVLGAFIEGGLDDPAALRATVSFADHPARYVRVRPIDQKEDFGWFVSELEVRGP
jgi:hypothetical protein